MAETAEMAFDGELELPPLSLVDGDEPAEAEKGRHAPPCIEGLSFLSRQVSAESEGASSTSSLMLESGEGARLPRSPFVGFLRHAPPQQLLYGRLDELLKRRSPPQEDDEVEEEPEPSAGSDGSEEKKVLPRASPYVGFQRHSPPTPALSFVSNGRLPPALPPLPEALALPELLAPGEEEARIHWPVNLFEEAWATVLSFAVELPQLGCLCQLARGFPEVLAKHTTWAGRPVRVSPELVPRLAPHLGDWLAVWKSVSKLILPRSCQLLSYVSKNAPQIPVEVAWRFDRHLKGDGVEVLRNGLTARRTSDEELVVLGDAALSIIPGRAPYLEVRIDELGEAIGDGVNDFGFGVTACDPEEIGELGAVADEVPGSWVVDFTTASVVLSINNQEATRGSGITSDKLREGDRVGVRLHPHQVEVFINGKLRQVLAVTTRERVPISSGLFPVIDLYGRTVQVSRTEADEPVP